MSGEVRTPVSQEQLNKNGCVVSCTERIKMSIAFQAMCFAREVHKHQKRKYTGNTYTDHLGEVAGIVASVPHTEEMITLAWLHDCVEDQGSLQELNDKFGIVITNGVLLLSDLEEGNRAERKRLSRERLSKAPPEIQTIKYADLISNTSSIVQFDLSLLKCIWKRSVCC